jgi:hypothetical protein
VAVAQFTPLPVLLKLYREHEIAPRYKKRARRRLITSAIVEPLRWYEKIRYGRRIRNTRIDPAPIFLLGYGRSGTTHLHNLLWQDPQFGVISTYQSTMNPFALSGRGWIERRLAGLVPATRPMDNVAITPSSPQEEEVALVNSTEHAALHFMSFPKDVHAIYDAYVCDLYDDQVKLRGFRDAYLDLLRKATVLSGGKRLVLKTPPNTARIPFLLENFPDAKFVHIVRNPYLVYQSMRNMYRRILPRETLQELDWDDIYRWTIEAYPRVMGRYLRDRERLAPNQLFEMRYEDLDARPLEVLQQLYDRLGIEGFESVRPGVQSYLDSLGSFAKNRFDFPRDVVESVNEHWGLAFDAFGYERVRPGTSVEN